MRQQSEEWLKFRKGKISASKSPVIMGASPYQTAYQLWEEELGMSKPKETAPHMSRGLEIEGKARQWFADNYGITMNPDVVCSQQNPLFIASLDGVCHAQRCILEIKNNNLEFHQEAKKGNIPHFHMIQIQHQLYVTDYREAYYLSWRDGDPVIVKVLRDFEMMEQIIANGIQFKYMLDNLIAPSFTDRDCEDMSNNRELLHLLHAYMYSRNAAKSHENDAEKCMVEIKKLVGDRSAKCFDYKVSRYNVKGRLNYEKIIEELLDGKDLESYRKPSTTYYKVLMD